LLQSARAQTAEQLEAQYGTCARHHIPEDKCTISVAKTLANADKAKADAIEQKEMVDSFVSLAQLCEDNPASSTIIAHHNACAKAIAYTKAKTDAGRAWAMKMPD